MATPYQGYGQSPQSYGQPEGIKPDFYDPKKDKGYGQEEGDEYNRDMTCCNSNSGFARMDNWCIFLCAFGGLLCLVSTFVPLWRVDSHGTTELERFWDYNGFDSKSYGVIHVKGSWSQSWTTLAQGACDIRNMGQIAGLGEAALRQVHWVKGGDCEGSEECQAGFASSMHMRCVEYQTMMRISMVTLCGTFIAFILIIGGTLVTSMSKRRKSGGMAFGLYLFGGLLLAIVNAVWAAVTDNSFKNLSLAAWYPYPSLHAGFYLHTMGYSLVLIFDTVFGFIVLPSVWSYDPAQEKLDKKKAKLEKRMAKEHQYAAKKEELKAIIAGQQPGQPAAVNFPPPPGYGQVAPAAYGQPAGYGQQPAPSPWGQQAYPQPAAQPAQPLGFVDGCSAFRGAS